jgi:hypothetical protein
MSVDGRDEMQIKAARNESLFRAANDRILGHAAGARPLEILRFLCECADVGCVDLIPLTAQEYHAARSEPTHFVVRPGHVNPAVERIITESRHHVVVEKIGLSAEIAEVLADST